MDLKFSAIGRDLFVAGLEAHGLPELGESETPQRYIERTANDEVMKHDLEQAVTCAYAGNAAGLSGCLHSVRTFFEKRDRPIVRTEQTLRGA